MHETRVSGVRNLGPIGRELAEWASGDIPRVPTGFTMIDSRTSGGVATGELLLFIARSGVGKTWWALNVLANNPQVPAVMFSLEMHARYVLSRLAAITTGTRTSQIEKAIQENGNSWAVEATIEKYPLLAIEDDTGMTIGDFHQTLDDYEQDNQVRPKLVVVDFVGLVRSFGMTQGDSIDQVIRGLKVFAREADVAVIALHQVNRGTKAKEKGQERAYGNEGHLSLVASDAMYGGEVHGDYIVGAYRPGMDPTIPQFEIKTFNMMEDFRIQFLKTRSDGGTSPVGLQHHIDQRTGKISELPHLKGVYQA